MKYLEKVLGIKVVYKDADLNHFSNYINARYRLQTVLLEGKEVIFLYPKIEIDQIGILKKHIERIKKDLQFPVVVVLKELTFRQKEYLMRDRIPFIVDGKQIYLPFMAVYLQERCDAEKQLREEILPSAQMLFLYFIYKGAQELMTSQAAKDLKLTSTSISRASKQLEEMGLLYTKKTGVQKILFSDQAPRVLFQNAKSKLVNPVKRKIYIPKDLVDINLKESGYSALAEYSMLNTPSVKCYATDKVSQWEKDSSNKLQDSNTQVAVEMWRYNPTKLSDKKMVDVLSLALALEEDTDERVEEAVEEMLRELWRQIDGCRN